VAAVSYIIVPIGAAVLLVSSGLRRSGPGSMAWAVIGAGVALWAMGEVIWQYYIAYLGVEVPYPGMADVFYVAAYPVMFIGVVMLPHVRGRKWERVRLGLDVVAGTVAVSALFWTFFLADVISLDSTAGTLENLVNLGYPVGDLMLLVATMILATRRSQLQFDGRILLLATGMALTAIADVLYVYQIEAGTYSEVGPLDTLWLTSYGLFAGAALLVAGPTRLRDQADRPGRVWPLVAPYSAIIVLFALTLGELGGQATTLQIATALVGLLIIVRQGVAIRETRDIVEKQRNDLVASISHELRTPLTAMKGFIEILDDQPDLDRTERLEMISIVNTQTNHLARIVGDLVEVARDKLESTRLSYHTVHVADLVDSAIGMLTGAPLRLASPATCRRISPSTATPTASGRWSSTT
jgi:signal transduction histidine kinase